MTFEYECTGCGAKVVLEASDREQSEYQLQGKLGWWQSMDSAGFVCSLRCAAIVNALRGIKASKEPPS